MRSTDGLKRGAEVTDSGAPTIQLNLCMCIFFTRCIVNRQTSIYGLQVL